ncbi:hypothetical protein ACGFI3_23600 [Nonomuraea wenchangensis]|uniref:hypothetical protein n=1 Tax=Nonomuraea wenchangensis TaxID=568860 RepID=UPI00371C7E43
MISRHDARQFHEDVLRRIDLDIRHSQGKPYIASDEKVLELARALVDAKVGGYDAMIGERLEGRLDNVMFRIV